ncbi:MAG TPA: OmpH family outer membrane protein [Verrucomicrobiae bacterium]|nr:OmpH family outer membrane protein [Verrucomicrobiae bacterium]
MKKISAFPLLALGMAALAHAQSPTKVAIIHVQNAILSTKEGQKAANELTSRFAPKKAELDKKQADLASIQDQLRKGSATMSDEIKAKLMREFDTGNKNLQRDTQDAQDELDQEQGKVMQELGNKMMGIIEKYANQNGIALVVDVSNPQTPVLWASQTIDITSDIVKLYDQANPGTGTTTAKPATPGTLAAPKPTTPAAITPAPVMPPAQKKK